MAFLLGVLLSLPSIAQISPKSAPVFADYPVSEIYIGKHAKAKTGKGVGQPHPLYGYMPSMFRTRLNEAAKSGSVNFAGHYILTVWGCGTGCLDGGIVDAKSGDVFWLPAVECCAGGDGFIVDKNSRLLVISTKSGQTLSAKANELLNKRQAAGEDIPYEDFLPPSVEHFYVFKGGKFEEVFLEASR